MLASSGAQPLSMQQLAGLAIRAADFDAAVKKVQPSVRREGFATTPDVTWNDVGSLAEVRPAVYACNLDKLLKHAQHINSQCKCSADFCFIYFRKGRSFMVEYLPLSR